MKKQFLEYSEFDNNILHDAVFSITGITFCQKNRLFQLTCFRLLDELYETRKIFPFVFQKKHKRKKNILVFNDIEKIEQKINADMNWYSIINVNYKRPKITIKTEGCLDLILYSNRFTGHIEDTEEILCDSFGYSDISFGRDPKEPCPTPSVGG